MTTHIARQLAGLLPAGLIMAAFTPAGSLADTSLAYDPFTLGKIVDGRRIPPPVNPDEILAWAAHHQQNAGPIAIPDWQLPSVEHGIQIAGKRYPDTQFGRWAALDHAYASLKDIDDLQLRLHLEGRIDFARNAIAWDYFADLMDAWKRHSAPFSKGDGDTGAEVMNRDEMKTLWDLSPLRTVTLSLADGTNIPWDAIVGCDHTNLVVQVNNESLRIPWEDLDPWTRMIFGTDNHRGMDQAPITQNETTTPNPETPEATTTEDPVDLEKLLATIPEKILTAIRENAATQYPDSHSNQLTIVQQEASAYNWINSTKQSAAKERNTLMLDTILKANTAHPGAFNTQKNFIEKEYDAAIAIGVTPDKYQPENKESENLILEAMDMPEECIAAMRRRAELAGPRRGQELIATETAAWGAILEIRSTATAEQIEIIDRVVNRFARTADFDMALRHIQTQLGLR